MLTSRFWAIMLIAFTVTATLVSLAYAQVEDISPDAWIFHSMELPEDIKTYATIGNGHVATVMHRDSVFMNGLYNGQRGFSHRARIPTKNNLIINVTSIEASPPSYKLNVKQGYYTETFTAGNFTFELRTFAHRYYHTIILTQIYITTIVEDPGNVTFSITNDEGNSTTADINFDDESYPEGLDATLTCGSVVQLEDKAYQGENYPTVCVLSKNIPDAEFNVQNNTVYTYFTSYARTSEVAIAEFTEVNNATIAGNHTQLCNEHVQRWENIWNNSAIEVTGNLTLSKIINAAFYYILTSLPITTPTFSPVGQFYGLSPGSLAFGAHNESKQDILEKPMDYQGHSFWDTETWMYPPILVFHPDKARELLNYRLNNVKAARDRAIKSGYRGARFPWESGLTGREVTPDCCEETRDLQIHISADVIYAIRQYIAITRDLEWLTVKKDEYETNGCGLIREVADFFASRTCYNENGFYDIKGVMPPDEDNYNNTVNNGYTNVMAGYAIFFAKYAKCLCGNNMTDIPEEWLKIARSLRFLYDEENDYHPEFEGFNLTNAKEIKQADVVLLGFPVMYAMNQSTRANDLRIYENLTRDDGPAMTWSMHTIGWLDLNNEVNSAAMFEQSYSRYVREPFKTWTEAIYPNSGAHNFITGMGGFLQSVINGYAGLRLYTEEMVVSNPRPLPNTSNLKLKGIKYLGSTLDMDITNSSVTLTLREGSSNNFNIFVERDGQSEVIIDGGVVSYNHTGQITFKIFTNTTTGCDLPEDKIGQNSLDNGNGDGNSSGTKITIILTFQTCMTLIILMVLI